MLEYYEPRGFSSEDYKFQPKKYQEANGILDSRSFLIVGKGSNSRELEKAYAENSREELSP